MIPSDASPAALFAQQCAPADGLRPPLSLKRWAELAVFNVIQ